MTQNLMEAKSLVELRQIKEHLTELKYNSVLIEKSKVFPINVLVCHLPKDNKERERNLSFGFMPVEENSFRKLSLLQLHLVLPEFEFKTNINDINLFITYLNQVTTIGSFSINHKKEIALRYIYTMPKYDLPDKGVIKELTQLFLLNVNVFGTKIEELALGNISLEDAMNQINGL